MAQKRTAKNFNDILLESIDEAFSTLGESAKSTIYLHLQKAFALSKNDIPDRVGDFSNALEQIFGAGARHLEILMMKCLHEKIDCAYKWEGPKWLVPDLTFTKYVKLLKLCFEDSNRIGEVEVILDAEEQQMRQM
jgi:hypothetical protein